MFNQNQFPIAARTDEVDTQLTFAQFSDRFGLGDLTVAAFTLEVVSEPYVPIPDAMAVVVCAGVLFLREVNGALVEMGAGRALDILGWSRTRKY